MELKYNMHFRQTGIVNFFAIGYLDNTTFRYTDTNGTFHALVNRKNKGAIMNKLKNPKTLVIAALMAALTCMATMIIQLPTPTFGYIHLGDTFVILCGMSCHRRSSCWNRFHDGRHLIFLCHLCHTNFNH